MPTMLIAVIGKKMAPRRQSSVSVSSIRVHGADSNHLRRHDDAVRGGNILPALSRSRGTAGAVDRPVAGVPPCRYMQERAGLLHLKNEHSVVTYA